MKITDVGAALDPQFERVSDTPRTDEQYNREKQYRSITNVTMSSHGFDAMTRLCGELERELDNAQAEIVRLKGEAESWEKVFDRTCEHLADAKTELAEAVEKERERCALVCERSVTAPAGTYQILMAAAKEIRKGE
jgi:hypothetical protein